MGYVGSGDGYWHGIYMGYIRWLNRYWYGIYMGYAGSGDGY